MTSARTWFIAVLFFFLTGCAVNDLGVVSVRYFENDSCYLLARESWGGYLSTSPTDGSLTFGHTQRFMVYPKPKNSANLTVNSLLQHPASYGFHKEVAANQVVLQDMRPFAWSEKNQGLSLHTNPYKMGFTAGIEARHIVQLPRDFDGVFIFHYYQDSNTVKAAVIQSSTAK